MCLEVSGLLRDQVGTMKNFEDVNHSRGVSLLLKMGKLWGGGQVSNCGKVWEGGEKCD